MNLETHGDHSPAISASGNVTVQFGFSAEDVEKLVRASLDGTLGPLADRLAELAAKLDVTENAALTLLRTVGREAKPEEIPTKLAEVATEWHKTRALIAAFDPDDPAVRELLAQAEAAIDDGRNADAHLLLSEAKALHIAAARKAREVSDTRLLQAAETSASQGSLALTEMSYRAAAAHFAEAAGLVPAGHPDEKGGYLMQQAYALYQQGDERGDNAALTEAIGVYRSALLERTRERVPLDWAKTWNSLGNALLRLGERENGMARLEEAVAAYRLALQEHTRERVPLQWAMTWNNLGNALQTLGERESGTALLEEAVAAYHSALQEYSRERAPLQWAGTSNNLGPAPCAGGAGEWDGAAGGGGGGLSLGPAGIYPRVGAVAVGCDLEQPRRRAPEAGGTGARDGAAGRGGGGLSLGLAGIHPRAGAAGLGDDLEQPRQRARYAWGAGERDGAAGGGCGGLSGGAGRIHPRERALLPRPGTAKPGQGIGLDPRAAVRRGGRGEPPVFVMPGLTSATMRAVRKTMNRKDAKTQRRKDAKEKNIHTAGQSGECK